MMMLTFQHSVRLFQEKTHTELGGPFWSDYVESVASLHGWHDGDSFATNYVAHPMMGATSGFIQIQNDPAGRYVEFGRSGAYWRSRGWALAAAAIYSAQFELGPMSEASIGNVGLKAGTMAYVDLLVTPLAGVGMIVAEDAIDRFLIAKVEGRLSPNQVRLLRSLLNPNRSVANIVRFQVPWKRDARGLVSKASLGDEGARTATGDRRGGRPGDTMNKREQLAQLEKAAELGGGEARLERQHQAGKLTARERMELLFDPGTFEEIDKLVVHRCRDFGMEDQVIPGDGVVSGFGRVDGRVVYAFAQDFTVFGGSLSETNAAKIVKIMDLAVRQGAPVVGPQRLGRRADPGRRDVAGRLRGHLPPQHARVGRRPADFGHHGAVRRRRGLLAGDHRLHGDGGGHELHVRDRARRHQDRHARGGVEGGPRRRDDAQRDAAASRTSPWPTTASACC